MLTTDRKNLLLKRLRAEGRLIAATLATELGVSEDTIRRDLRDLAAAGHLLRVHGGALPLSPTHLPLADRKTLQSEAKTRLGQAAAALVSPGQVVIIDGGTTHLALIAALPHDLALTVVTHSPGITMALEHHRNIDVQLIGGRLFRHSMVAMGAQTAAAYARIRADLCFVGVTGVHPEAGLTTGDAEEADLKREMITAAAETIVLATPDKIGMASPWQIAPLEAAHQIITDGPHPDWLSRRS